MAVGRAKKAMAVGRYELVYELAPSYLGPLWAVHSESGDGLRHVALLRQVSLAGLDADTRVRLLEAAWQAMELRHERICPVADVVASDGELGVVSDYIEGQTLRALQGLANVRRSPMPVAVALRILLDVAEAVSAVHRACVEFGDEAISLYGGISADSVIVGTNGRAFLTDVALSSAGSLVETLGSNPDRVAYEAPEQVSTPPTADARTDVFSVGILAWELLSNRRLFIGSDKAVTQKVLVAKIPRLDEVKRRGDFVLPDDLLRTVMKALEREPSSRFDSADALLSALRTSGVEPADESVVRAYVQNLAEGVLDRMRDALKDSAGARFELGSRVQSKAPNEPKPARLDATKRSIDKSLTDTVPNPDRAKEIASSPVATAGAAPPAAAPLPVEPKPIALPKPALDSKPKAAAEPKPRPIAFEAKPRLPVQTEAKPKLGLGDPKVRAADPRQAVRRATILGVAPPGAAARKPAAAAPAPVPVTAAQATPSVQPAKPRARQPTMIGIPPPAANAAPILPRDAPAPAPVQTPPAPQLASKSQEAKQAIFDSMPPPAPTPPAPIAAKNVEEEPTGQYDTHDLLKQFETMGRRTDPGKTGGTPDFPEPPTKPRVAIPAPVSAPPADGGWLDEPDAAPAAAPTRQESPPAPVVTANRKEPIEPSAKPAEVEPSEPGSPATPAANVTPSLAPRPVMSKPPPSMPPPAHVLPSLPPPLIHDPRANRSQTARPAAAGQAPSRMRNVVLGALASVVIATASAAIGIVALGGRNPIRAEKPEVLTSPVVAAAPAAEPTTVPSAAETPSPATEQPDKAAAVEAPATAEAAAPVAAAAPVSAAAPPRAPAPALASPAPAHPQPAQKPVAAPKKKKGARYVPDDI
jgi:serine/threonine-protein kinase